MSLAPDTLEQLAAGEALERHRALFEALDQGVLYLDARGAVRDANPAALRLLGRALERLRGEPLVPAGWRGLDEDGGELEAAAHPAQVALRTGAPVRGVVLGERGLDGEPPRWLRTSAVPWCPAPGAAPLVLVTLEDVTQRKRADDAVARRLELAVRAGHLGVWDWDLRSNTMVWDEEMLRLYGLTPATFSGGIEAWNQGLHPEDRERAFAECEAALAGTRTFDTEFRVVHPGGEVRHVKADGLVLRDERGQPVRMLGLNQDVTARKRAEEDYRVLFAEMLDGFALHELVCDASGRPVDYRFLAVNPAFERMTGLRAETVRGRTVLELLPGTEPQWIERYGQVALTGEPCLFESYSEPLKKHFEVRAFRPGPGQFACIFADVTERRRADAEKGRLEHQLRQAQKMESVGRLAGGVAHDFNNMLGAILGHTELALDVVRPGEPLYEDLQGVQSAARRSADLTRQLLAFARKQTVSPRALALDETIGGMLKMLQRLIGEGIRLTWRPGAGLWPVFIDPSQVDQVLANLCVNARDAMEGRGALTIELGNVSVDEAACLAHPAYLPGDHVCLTVTDDGCGMDPETQALIFEPFFTTKEPGQGTGLGLATVYGIVRQNEGFLDVASARGAGTTFRVFLPRHLGEARPAEAAAGYGPTARGRETILVVEDEPAILRITVRMLERLGYTVVSASRPLEALRLARDHAPSLRLLLTDVVMPEMSGRELAAQVASVAPGLRRLFMSGYPDNVIAHQGVLDAGVAFIPKPFSAGELAAKVRATLDAAS